MELRRPVAVLLPSESRDRKGADSPQVANSKVDLRLTFAYNG